MMDILALLTENRRVAITGIAVFVVIVVITAVVAIQQNTNDPGYCIEKTDEQTGETIIECPNRDPEAYEPEERIDQQSLDRIASTLPVYRDRYEIDFEHPETGEGTVPIIIRVISREVPPPPDDASSDSEQVRRYREYIREHRRQALSHLEELGFERDTYQIFYTEDYLIEEFKGSYWGDRLQQNTSRNSPDAEN